MENPVVKKAVIVKWEIDGGNSCDLIARIHCGYVTAEANLERLNSTRACLVVVIDQEQTDCGCSILGQEDS